MDTPMGAIAFDTLKFAKRLKEAGFTEPQAEALAAAEAEFIEDNLATKRDIIELRRDLKELEVALKQDIAELKRDMKELEVALKRDIKELEVALRTEIKQLDVKIEQIRVGLKHDIEELRVELKRDMKDIEYRMTIKLGAMLVIAVGAMATLTKLL
jgi:hypothetical protein